MEEALCELLKDVENPLPEVALEVGLAGKRFLAKPIKQAAPLPVAVKREGPEK